MKLTLGFSPCPNDTFIFDAMIHGKIDTEGLDFDVIMEDVEALNMRAMRKELAITKLSYHAFAYMVNDYALLQSGSALGKGVGPLLIAKDIAVLDKINDAKIAIPGRYTTANFLCSLAFPTAQKKIEIIFNEIEDKILRGEVDAGVIIHENRFTYQKKGLVKLMDLGAYWETTTQMPIPLGGIVVKKDLPHPIQQAVQRVMQRSVMYAFEHPQASREYVAQYAQEMDEHVRQQHIDLYVNDYTKNLGADGLAAINYLFKTAYDKKITPIYTSNFFVK
jgi:1,4-dihydroxy-6-naphthoate synthase